jgi:hypothetical protein
MPASDGRHFYARDLSGSDGSRFFHQFINLFFSLIDHSGFLPTKQVAPKEFLTRNNNEPALSLNFWLYFACAV